MGDLLDVSMAWMDPWWDPEIGLLWIAIVFTALLGLTRVFAAEREHGLLDGLVLAPIDRSLIVADMLSPRQRNWLNAYHAQVWGLIGPQLDGDAKAWLEEQCRPI